MISLSEPPIWRNRWWHIWQQHCKIDDLAMWPQTRHLHAILEKIGRTPQKAIHEVTYTDGHYNYQYREDRTVVRILRAAARHPDTMQEPPKETHPHKKNVT